MPAVSVMSLIATGRPCRAPSGSPFTTAVSAARAASRACSAASVTIALSLRVDPLDHRQMRVEHLDRTHVAAADEARQLARGPAGEAHVDHHLFVSWSMIFSENRYPLFGIMLYLPDQWTKRRSTSRNSRLSP